MSVRLFRPKLGNSPLLAFAALALGVAAAPLSAAPILDAPNDFLPTFNGPHNGDLDVLSAEVFYDGTNFTFRSTENGAIGTTPDGLFVWASTAACTISSSERFARAFCSTWWWFSAPISRGPS